LDQEVAGIWRPFALYGRSKHRRQVVFQFDFQGVLVGRHDDGVDQATERLSGFHAGLWIARR
jgi:hypothetical protein